ncbi:alpha/beta fold hydrolase [Pelagibius litoralis]|uniref:Alpha/beta fold hydrolase n=1 Tax=Pelagibius litoralis TaxID=374515 RepID=A0A967EXX1_9PROT|nr:alpha/beta fold hydrolase [Pelagibius litoralis]NIA69414.1 alpha/beta fold hydrolase [Pelagibius litoralis]
MPDLHLGSLVMEDHGEGHGEGTAVVLVHGLGGSSNSFQTLMGALEGYRVLRPDLPGAGRSALRPGRPGLRGLTSAVGDALRSAGVERAHLVGHSMGTLICQYLAVSAPECVLSLTLFGPILVPPAAAKVALKERAETARAEGMAGIAGAVAGGSVAAASRAANPVVTAFVRESLMRQDPAGYAAHCDALSTAEAADHPAIQAPTLLVAGENDPVAPVAMAQQLNAQIAGSTLEIIPSVAHWMMMEAPQRSADLLRSHLDATAP